MGCRALVVPRVDDPDAGLTAEVTARGAEFTRGPGPLNERTPAAYLEEAEGNLIGLQEWSAPRGHPDGAPA